MSWSLNSLKEGSIGKNDRVYPGDARRLDYSLYDMKGLGFQGSQ